jgi:tetratricopeptide (TPR) repeat protein
LKVNESRILILCITIQYSVQLSGQLTNDSTVVKTIWIYAGVQIKNISPTTQQIQALPDFNKGYYLLENHEYNKGIKFLKRAITIDSIGNCGTGEDGVAYSEIGYAYMRLGDYPNALEYLNKAININAFNASAYLSIAVIMESQKDFQEALQTLDTLNHRVPEYAIGYAQKGFILEHLGKNELALIEYNKFIKLVNEQGQANASQAMIQDVEEKIKNLKAKDQ